MVKKGGQAKTFKIKQYILLAILPKNRLSGEAARLACRIYTIAREAYTIISKDDQIKGLHQALIFKVISPEINFNISFPKPKNPVLKKIILPNAVTLANYKKNISAIQKAGRKGISIINYTAEEINR
jgi:hypothetical protein